MVGRVLIDKTAFKVSKAGVEVTTAGIGDLALSISARQGQILASGFKTPDTSTNPSGFIFVHSATVTFPTLPANADAFVQPIAGYGVDTTDDQNPGLGFLTYNPSLAVGYIDYYIVLNPGPMDITFGTTSLAMSITCNLDPTEFAGFRYVILRKPLAA